MKKKKMADFQELAEIFSSSARFVSVKAAFPDFTPQLERKTKKDLPEALQRVWNLAVFEIESNIRPCPYGGKYFTAGGRGGWHDMLFGQDTTGTALLALNRLYPEVMKNHIRSYALARLNIGFLCPKDWVLEGCEKSLKLTEEVWVPASREFCERYHLSPCLNRTGMDAGWIWAAGDLFDRSGDEMDWAWLYGTGDLFFREFYQPFYDETDGLYFGQASFIDVGCNGYPLSFGEMHTQKSRNAAVFIKAASTNALYVRSMDVMAHAAKIIGLEKKSRIWQSRADALREAIKKYLRFPDGTFAYFKHRDGRLEEKREALGAAFCILADVVRGEEAARALAADKLPQKKEGVALFYPFYEDNPQIYHNRSAWPFASTFYHLAWEKATGESKVREDALQLASSITAPEKLRGNDKGTLFDYRTGTFQEYIRWEDGTPAGTCAQSWTVSAFLNLAMRAGFLENTPEKSRFLS